MNLSAPGLPPEIRVDLFEMSVPMAKRKRRTLPPEFKAENDYKDIHERADKSFRIPILPSTPFKCSRALNALPREPREIGNLSKILNTPSFFDVSPP